MDNKQIERTLRETTQLLEIDGAIFVRIRIVFSQIIPTAGLYRHGAAYQMARTRRSAQRDNGRYSLGI